MFYKTITLKQNKKIKNVCIFDYLLWYIIKNTSFSNDVIIFSKRKKIIAMYTKHMFVAGLTSAPLEPTIRQKWSHSDWLHARLSFPVTFRRRFRPIWGTRGSATEKASYTNLLGHDMPSQVFFHDFSPLQQCEILFN